MPGTKSVQYMGIMRLTLLVVCRRYPVDVLCVAGFSTKQGACPAGGGFGAPGSKKRGERGKEEGGEGERGESVIK